MKKQHLTPSSWQQQYNMMYHSIRHFIALVFIQTVQLIRAKIMLLLNLFRILHPSCPQQAHLF